MSLEKRQKIYSFLKSYIEAHGFPPTVREISAHCGLSHGAVIGHLRWLERHGQISRSFGTARGITLISETPVDPIPPEISMRTSD